MISKDSVIHLLECGTLVTVWCQEKRNQVWSGQEHLLGVVAPQILPSLFFLILFLVWVNPLNCKFEGLGNDTQGNPRKGFLRLRYPNSYQWKNWNKMGISGQKSQVYSKPVVRIIIP